MGSLSGRGEEISSRLERILRDQHLQENLLRRALAYLVDFLICSIPAWIVLETVASTWLIGYPVNRFFLLEGAIQVAYGSILEYSRGATLGKSFARLRVALFGESDPSTHFARNLSKLHPVLLLLDVILGYLYSPDPRQKLTDKAVDAFVVVEKEAKGRGKVREA